jgi:hypothetical protein
MLKRLLGLCFGDFNHTTCNLYDCSKPFQNGKVVFQNDKVEWNGYVRMARKAVAKHKNTVA